jgi:hypothetical protein
MHRWDMARSLLSITEHANANGLQGRRILEDNGHRVVPVLHPDFLHDTSAPPISPLITDI